MVVRRYTRPTLQITCVLNDLYTEELERHIECIHTRANMLNNFTFKCKHCILYRTYLVFISSYKKHTQKNEKSKNLNPKTMRK